MWLLFRRLVRLLWFRRIQCEDSLRQTRRSEPPRSLAAGKTPQRHAGVLQEHLSTGWNTEGEFDSLAAIKWLTIDVVTCHNTMSHCIFSVRMSLRTWTVKRWVLLRSCSSIIQWGLNHQTATQEVLKVKPHDFPVQIEFMSSVKARIAKPDD